MKKLYLVIISLCFFFSVEAQFDCSTAIKYDITSSLPIAPVGSIAQAGPDYSCIANLNRPTWFYLSVCPIAAANPHTATLFLSSDISVAPEVMIWGPFNNLSNACSQLTGGNIFFCTYTGIGSLLFNQSGVYIGLITAPTASNNINFSLSATSSGFEAPVIDVSCNVCNDTATYIHQPICVVSFDSITGKNKIIWDKLHTPAATDYIILRENSFSQYDSIGTVLASMPGEFVDLSSNPQVKSERYKIKTIDQCMNTAISVYGHRTIHLSASLGVNNVVNLSWNIYQPWLSTAGSFYIYRSTPSTSPILLDSVSSGITTYTDLNPPSGQVNYQIEYRVPNNPGCLIQSSILSNNKVFTITGIAEINPDLINIFPNPANDKFIIEIPDSFNNSGTLYIKSIDGRVVNSFELLTSKEEINIAGLSSGMYFIEISNDDSIARKKILIQ